MRIGSLCSGYAGLDMAVEDALGATTAWFCEYDRDPSAILAHHWPHVPNHGDVKATDWSQVEPVDILTAGYPCQPFSHAGKRKGSDDPRHLWPDVARAIGALRPRLVVLENVRGHVSLGLADVLGDLSGLGYDARWGVVRAADAGAPHGRARIFIVASPDTRSGSLPRTAAAGDGLPVAPQRGHLAPADASRERHGRGEDAAGVGRLDGANAGTPRERERARGVPVDRSAATAPDAEGIGWTGQDESRAVVVDDRSQPTHARQAGRTDFGVYGPAVARWEHVLGRTAPDPTEPGRNGRPRLSPVFVEWLMGLDPGHVTDPAIGLSRNAQLKALGNGVVPRQAVLALRTLLPLAEAS